MIREGRKGITEGMTCVICLKEENMEGKRCVAGGGCDRCAVDVGRRNSEDVTSSHMHFAKSSQAMVLTSDVKAKRVKL